MVCEYAYNIHKDLVHIKAVENGLKCNCTCIACGARMVAKNGGNEEIKVHHFAHESGKDCGGYRETLFHIWSKEIIEEYKSLSVPAFGGKFTGWLFLAPSMPHIFSLPEQQLHFTSVEVETYSNGFKPDIVGITEEGIKLWIEIYVTHKCSEDKISSIIQEGINCIEIKIPDNIETKEELKGFLIDSTESDFKAFINYPYGDNLIHNQKKQFYQELKKKCQEVEIENCHKCYRENLLQQVYESVLKKYEADFAIKYNYIYKHKLLIDLIRRYPKLFNLPYALDYKQGSIVTTKEKAFARHISVFEEYKYGSMGNMHWNCPRIDAVAEKEGRTMVFCLNHLDNESQEGYKSNTIATL